MNKIIGIVIAVAMVTFLTGCPDGHRYKKGNNHHAGKHQDNKGNGRIKGDNGRQSPNCSADGRGCNQYNPNK